MISGLIGKKLGMTQIFDREGNVVPITVVEVGPCVVLDLKDNPKKVKLGYGDVKESRLNKAMLGFYKKIGVTPRRMMKEFASTNNADYKIGQEIKADFFKAGDYVDVTGTSIGKGFQGGMKLHNWRGGKATHGSMHHRRVGSIGSSAFPSRPFTGRTMPAHMGVDKVTQQGLRVMGVDADKNLLLLKGAVPGHERGTIIINRSYKKAFKALDEQKVTVAKKVNPMKQSKKAAGATKPAKGGK